MFALLIPLLAAIPGIIGKFFSDKNELLKAKQAAELAIEQARIELAGQIATQQMEVSKAVLGSTSPQFKYFTFFMWFGPFMIGVVWPSKAHDIFVNLGTMPEWYVQSCMLIMFTVWGIAVGGPVVSGIFSNLGDFFAAARADKIELKKVDKKVFFDALRHIKGVVSPADVAQWDPVIDEVNKGS